MRYVAAYLLAVLGGNTSPSEADIKKILSSVGIDADSKCIQKVINELKGKDVEEVLAQGRMKLASVPAGGAVATTTALSAATPTSAAPAKEEKKAEAKKEESEGEASDEDMGFGLFD